MNSKYYETHKEAQKSAMHEWYINNKQRRYELNKKWRETNPDYNRQLKRKHRLAMFYRKGELHLIENYALAKQDDFHGWALHHRLELTMDNKHAHSMKEMIRLGIYYHRPYFELIFLPISEHTKLHKLSKK